MSQAARQAVLTALLADTALIALLAKRKGTTDEPAILLERGPDTPVFPCLTYRFDSLTPDPKFRPTPAEGGGQSPVTDARAEFRIWSKGPVAIRDQIAARVRVVLEGQDLTLPDDAGYLFRAEIIVETPDQWDARYNAFFHLMRFRLRLYTPTPTP